jgi:hypothetical protein
MLYSVRGIASHVFGTLFVIVRYISSGILYRRILTVLDHSLPLFDRLENLKSY